MPVEPAIIGKWGASDCPSEDGTLGPWVAPWMIGINNDSPNKDAAWEFIKWVLSDEIQKKLAATGTTPPCRFSLLKDPGFLNISSTGEVLNAQLRKGTVTWPYVIQYNIPRQHHQKIIDKNIGKEFNNFIKYICIRNA